MEWGIPVQWGWFLLFSYSGGHKTKETYPTNPGSPTPCKQGLRSFWKFLVVVVQNNGKEMYKKIGLHVQSCFFANQTYFCFSPFAGVAFAAQHYMILYFVRTNYKYYRELRFQPWLNIYIILCYQLKILCLGILMAYKLSEHKSGFSNRCPVLRRLMTSALLSSGQGEPPARKLKRVSSIMIILLTLILSLE